MQYLREHRLYDPVAEGLLSAVTYDRTCFDKIVASGTDQIARKPLTSCGE